MPKDDYIRIRCDTRFKDLVNRTATEKNMTITDYIEYLVRKDVSNMMYVYWEGYLPNGFSCDILDDMESKGLGVKLDEEYLLSKNEKVTIDGIEIKSFETFEDWICGLSGCGHIELTDYLTIEEDDVINIFIGELYQPATDEGETYADIIYRSDKPYEQVKKYMLDFTNIAIEFKISDIQIKAEQIKREIKNGTFDWC